jgi:hypothetical protein
MMMRNYTSNSVLLVLALFLMSPTLVGIMQLQQAYATNESSYKYGFQAGKSEWQSCAYTNGEGDCTAAHDYCSDWIRGSVYNATIGYDMQTYLGHVSNVTACVDGYVHAWNHVCDPVKAKKADTMPCPLVVGKEDIN